MKYTKSLDGEMRATVRAEMRLEEEEIKLLRAMAKKAGVSTKKFLCRCLADAFYGAACNHNEESFFEERAKELKP